MDLNSFLFYIIATITGVSAIGVVVTQNIVRAAVWLLFTLAGTAGIFFLLDADFVGATQLLVYVGGTLVLVVFGVMLTAQGPFINLRIGVLEWVLSAGAGLVLFSVLAFAIWPSESFSYNAGALGNTDRPLVPSIVLGEALLSVKNATPENATIVKGRPVPLTVTGTPAATSRSRKQMTYLLPFEIVSVHLLVVLIGAAYLARAKRRRTASEQPT